MTTTPPMCAECSFGTITLHSSDDKCSHANNTAGMHPYALRHDETLCGTAGAWFVVKPAPSAIYSAAEATK